MVSIHVRLVSLRALSDILINSSSGILQIVARYWRSWLLLKDVQHWGLARSLYLLSLWLSRSLRWFLVIDCYNCSSTKMWSSLGQAIWNCRSPLQRFNLETSLTYVVKTPACIFKLILLLVPYIRPNWLCTRLKTSASPSIISSADNLLFCADWEGSEGWHWLKGSILLDFDWQLGMGWRICREIWFVQVRHAQSKLIYSLCLYVLSALLKILLTGIKHEQSWSPGNLALYEGNKLITQPQTVISKGSCSCLDVWLPPKPLWSKASDKFIAFPM